VSGGEKEAGEQLGELHVTLGRREVHVGDYVGKKR
jgi:hypothetical protein